MADTARGSGADPAVVANVAGGDGADTARGAEPDGPAELKPHPLQSRDLLQHRPACRRAQQQGPPLVHELQQSRVEQRLYFGAERAPVQVGVEPRPLPRGVGTADRSRQRHHQRRFGRSILGVLQKGPRVDGKEHELARLELVAENRLEGGAEGVHFWIGFAQTAGVVEITGAVVTSRGGAAAGGTSQPRPLRCPRPCPLRHPRPCPLRRPLRRRLRNGHLPCGGVPRGGARHRLDRPGERRQEKVLGTVVCKDIGRTRKGRRGSRGAQAPSLLAEAAHAGG
eukprot:scaffold32002_cov94-Isochrysis_galbana.AAC.3